MGNFDTESNPMLLHTASSGDVDVMSLTKVPEGYFAGKGDVLESGEKGLVERYMEMKVRPYIAVVDYNNSEDEPYENKPKMSVEVGVSVDF